MWHVRTLLDRDTKDRPQRRTTLIASELARYNSKTRMTVEGELCERGAGYTFFWRGAEERREAGVGFAIKTTLAGKLVAYPKE